mmetsp:Transcript_9808/g.21994  ORF Transcript_9808/g.21994 Transcript_9808/m.21994 type:complete len:698 (+) Transcript_9808:198-2291(+)
MNKLRRRLSMTLSKAPPSMVVEGDSIDDLMKTLYVDPALLEERCAASAKGLTYPPAVKKEPHADERAVDAVLSELPPGYFTPDFDPVGPNLEEVSTWAEGDYVENFMQKIEEGDLDQDEVIGLVTTQIENNYSQLMECMELIQSIDVDLCMTGIQLSHGRSKIRSAGHIMNQGVLSVTRLHAERDKLSKRVALVASLQALRQVHRGMLDSLNMGEVGGAAVHAKTLLDCLHLHNYSQFLALKTITHSTVKNVVTIRRKSDKALRRLCGRKFSAPDYASIVLSYLLTDHLSHTLGIPTHLEDPHDLEEFYFDSLGGVEGLAQRINRYQLEDIDACLHSAVMEYIYASQQKKHRAGLELAIAGAYLQMDMGEIVDLAEVPLNILYPRLTSDLLASCVVRSCELLADIVHTHYLLTQWHLTPFHPLNSDPALGSAHLHRSPLDLDEEEGEGEGDVEESYDNLEGAYNPRDYAGLNVSVEVRDLFQYVERYKPHEVPLDTPFKCFIPEYIPAIGELDAFIKVPRPDGGEDGLGLRFLDEPSANQSDPTVLELQLRAKSKKLQYGDVAVRSIEHADKNPSKIEKWVQDIKDLHRSKPPPQVNYKKNMPDIDTLMEVWPEEFEQMLATAQLPSPDLDLRLPEYAKVLCSVLDIPTYENPIESLHVLFSLYSDFRNNQHFANNADAKQGDYYGGADVLEIEQGY